MKPFLGMVVLVAVVAFGVGCGGNDGVSQAELKLAEMKAAETARLKEQLREKTRRLKEAKKAKQGSGYTNAVSTPSGSTASGSIPSYRESCGDDVYASGSASCGFAGNIAAAYRSSPSSTLYDIYSPATGLEYTVSCSGGSVVTCTGGRAAVVYFR